MGLPVGLDNVALTLKSVQPQYYVTLSAKCSPNCMLSLSYLDHSGHVNKQYVHYLVSKGASQYNVIRCKHVRGWVESRRGPCTFSWWSPLMHC